MTVPSGEQTAREQIDQMSQVAGRQMQSRNGVDQSAGTGMAMQDEGVSPVMLWLDWIYQLFGNTMNDIIEELNEQPAA